MKENLNKNFKLEKLILDNLKLAVKAIERNNCQEYMVLLLLLSEIHR